MILLVGLFVGLLRCLVTNFRFTGFSTMDNPLVAVECSWKRVLLALSLISRNFKLLLIPRDLCHDWSFGTFDISQINFLQLGQSLLLLLAALEFGRRANRFAQFSLLWLSICYLPISNIILLVGFVQAERCLYLLIPPFLTLMGHGVEIISKEIPKDVFKLLKFLTIALYIGKTWQRAEEWSSEYLLNSSAVKLGSLKSQVNLAAILGEEGRYNISEALLQNALKKRQTSDIYYNLGLMQQKTSQLEKAKDSYTRCLQLRGRHVLCQLNLGVLYESYSNYSTSEKLYKGCHEENLSCRFNYARINYDFGRYEKAVAILTEAAHALLATRENLQYSRKERASFFNLLSISLLKLKKIEQAKYWNEQSLIQNPNHVPARTANQLLRNITQK